MKLLFFFCGLILFSRLSAQLPEDALRAFWTTPSGSAREQAIGGAMGSLGGDISAASVNPAGLGLYKTREVVISPGFRFLTDKSNYLGTGASGSATGNFSLGSSGIVIGYTGMNDHANTFALTINRTADFSKNIYYKGQNNYSSLSEQYAEEFAGSGLTIDQGLSSPALSYGTRMALYTSLIDTATINGVTQVIGQPQKAGLLNQENDLRSTGGITEIGISLATNKHDKWYIGGTLGIPILSYTRYQTYRESDATGNTNNDFDSFIYQEKYTSSGAGVNLKLGAIFSPSASLRLGLAIHTPSLLYLTDNISASMITRTENYTSLQQVSISSDSLDMLAGTSANAVKYELNTPWKFIVSGSYLFGAGVENTRQQKGFITADLEYTTHNARFYQRTDNEDDVNGSSTDNGFYDALNSTISSYYKGVLGARLGGELKFNILAVRAGLAYYSSPYADATLKADRFLLSGGLGWRNKGMFVDLSYVQQFSRNVDFPYRLSDKNNVMASLNETGGTVLATVGYKF